MSLETTVQQSIVCIKVAVFGAEGRMGQQIIAQLQQHPRLHYFVGITRQSLKQEHALIHQLAQCDVLIDFSIAEAQVTLMNLLKKVAQYKTNYSNKQEQHKDKQEQHTEKPIISTHPLALVSGVTALSQEQFNQLKDYSQGAAVFYAPNFSLGIALMKRMVQQASHFLADDFDIEIFELHHRQKKDAPSGTAMYLAQAAAEAHPHEQAHVNIETNPLAHYEKKAHQIHVSAGRGGQVIGEHFVYFLGAHERIEITHRAHHRSLFAQGALRATEWVHLRTSGYYQMDDLWD